MSGQICPACGSENVKVYKKDGEKELHCNRCHYDRGEKYEPRRFQRDERDKQGAR